MTPRTLRCANAALYLIFLLVILGAAGYVACTQETDATGLAGLVALCAAALLWGGSYILLRYDIDEAGVTRRKMGGRRFMAWRDIRRAELRETRQQEVASCTIMLWDEEGEMSLSSDLLPLEEVQALAEELKQRGILPSDE